MQMSSQQQYVRDTHTHTHTHTKNTHTHTHSHTHIHNASSEHTAELRAIELIHSPGFGDGKMWDLNIVF